MQVEKNKNRKSKAIFWKCQCKKCNSFFYVSTSNMPKTKSCGCLRFNNPLKVEDLTGKKFGKLTVIHRDIERDENEIRKGIKRRNAHWLCKCDCGNSKLSSVTGYELKSGRTRSCGCLQSEITAKRNMDSVKNNRILEIENDIVKMYAEDDEDFFIVDLDDYDFIKKWYWRKDEKGYWITNAKKNDIAIYNKQILRLHQLIAERKYGSYDTKKLFPDHLSRNKSDNRKCNLILKTNADNMKNRSLSKANTSGKTGVSYSKDKNLWIAYITINYNTIFLGSYSEYNDAINARLAAEEHYGFTCDNKTASYDYSTVKDNIEETERKGEDIE